jgi:hypothetical protein
MTDSEKFIDVQSRIEREIHYHNGSLPEMVAIAWDGYIAAMLEWSLITPDEHSRLSKMLPQITDNPVIAILLGR